jgi:hypothetical protein
MPAHRKAGEGGGATGDEFWACKSSCMLSTPRTSSLNADRSLMLWRAETIEGQSPAGR